MMKNKTESWAELQAKFIGRPVNLVSVQDLHDEAFENGIMWAKDQKEKDTRELEDMVYCVESYTITCADLAKKMRKKIIPEETQGQ